MSEKMYPIPFRSLMNWVVTEYAGCGDVFGVHKQYHATGKSLPIFGERIETPFGPAAGPNSQLAQNIIAAYVAGARFFEVKTVQKMDGADLAACINRPCILAEDECYNCEWSTELYVQQAFEEYVKAWCALKIMAKVYGLGDPNGFVFNMSVGYDLEGIKGEEAEETAELSAGALFMQGVATSIDALSVGFTISEYGWLMALVCSLIVAAVTFFICEAGLSLGKKFGTKLSGKASILGGVILIGIGLEIFISGVFG